MKLKVFSVPMFVVILMLSFIKSNSQTDFLEGIKMESRHFYSNV